jgi:hypothetical protein
MPQRLKGSAAHSISRKAAKHAMEKHAKGKIIYYFSTLRAQHIANAFNPFAFAALRHCVKPILLPLLL